MLPVSVGPWKDVSPLKRFHTWAASLRPRITSFYNQSDSKQMVLHVDFLESVLFICPQGQEG